MENVLPKDLVFLLEGLKVVFPVGMSMFLV